MVCERCHGRGIWVYRVDRITKFPDLNARLCPDCGGSGIVHCCEGDREQPMERECESALTKRRKVS